MSVALNTKPITAIHKKDPEWIIALWLAIHGGDPAPQVITAEVAEKTAASAIRALSGYLAAGKQKAVTTALGH